MEDTIFGCLVSLLDILLGRHVMEQVAFLYERGADC